MSLSLQFAAIKLIIFFFLGNPFEQKCFENQSRSDGNSRKTGFQRHGESPLDLKLFYMIVSKNKIVIFEYTMKHFRWG
jgi:hypothetical protein